MKANSADFLDPVLTQDPNEPAVAVYEVPTSDSYPISGGC